jgi:outer membrane protein, heavy metal efflux system
MRATIKKFTLRTALVLAAFTCDPTGLFAQVIGLDSVFYYININNPMLLEYDQRIQAQQAYAEGAKAWMAPMAGLGPYWVPYAKPEEHTDTEGMYMAFVEQEIPNPSKQRAKKNYASSKVKVEAEARNYQFNVLKSEARELYYSSVVLTRQLAVLDENKRIIELMLKLARIRYPYNQASLGSIYKVEARLYEIDNMRYMTEGEIDQAMVRLKALMNVDYSRHIAVDTTIQITFNPGETYDTLDLHERRSDVRQLDQTINTMRLNQELQQRSARPDFKIRFEHMQPRDSEMQKLYSAMAMITIPIAPWSSKMYKSEVRGMNAEIEAMKLNRQAILNEARGMIAGMQIQLSRMAQQLENYNSKILPALRKNYETTMLAYEENREQLPSVLDGWEAYSMARMEYLNKQREYYAMIVAYEKALEK